MAVYVVPGVAALGSGAAILIGGLQTWATISASGVLINISGMGEFTSPSPLTSAALAARHGFPVAWITGVAAVVIIVAAGSHLLGVSTATAVAGKGIMLPALVCAIAAVVGLVRKADLIKVSADELVGVQLSAGSGPFIVLVAAAVAVFFGLSLSGLGAAEADGEA